MTTEDRTCINPIEDQRKQALAHYDEASSAIYHWSSFVENAIKAYDPEDETMAKLKKENKDVKKEIERIKNHFRKVCDEQKKKYSDNTAILIFIQQMEESITWVNEL